MTGHGTVLHIITNDKAFLVDSISELIHSLGYKISIFLHPIIEKSPRNQILPSTGHKQSNEQTYNESVLYIELTNQLVSSAKTSLVDEIQQLLSDITSVTSDWSAMLSQIESVICANNQINKNYDLNSFLQWLGQDNFVFLGHYIFLVNEESENSTDKRSLGILRKSDSQLTLGKSELKSINKELTTFIADDSPLLVSKSNLKSTIHRHDYYDQVNVKEFSAQGKIIAVHRFIGLFTQVANKLSPNKIPYLKCKLDEILQRLSLKVDSHNYRKFTHILASLPKRELYESSVEQLLGLAKGIYNLNAKSKSGIFIRENEFNQQVSVLVFVSKEAFCTDLRDDIENELVSAFNGKILSRRSMLNDDYLAQWHFIVEKDKCSASSMAINELISQIEVKTQSWNENLTTLINQHWHSDNSTALDKKYSNAFSKSYQEQFVVNEAIEAIDYLEKLNHDNQYQFQIYRDSKTLESRLKLNIYTFEKSVTLSDSIPILENFDFKPLDEFSFKIQANEPNDSVSTVITNLYSYTLEYSANSHIDIANLKTNIEDALSQVWAGNIENDGYNKLLLSANINIRQIVIIRSYGKYLRQLGLGYSEEYFQQALINYPNIVYDLINFFETRFALNSSSIEQRNTLANDIKNRLLQNLNNVKKIDHDRILRNFIDAISATVRTNFYQFSATEKVKNYCSFKIRSGEIEDAPQPRPYVETFVYSPRVEGVHMRFGLVSRGGLRWSDRSEDFRTEILGLVKAQQVKNVVERNRYAVANQQGDPLSFQ